MTFNFNNKFNLKKNPEIFFTSIFLLITILILFIWDTAITVPTDINFKGLSLDWEFWWSTWDLLILAGASFFLIFVHFFLEYKRKRNQKINIFLLKWVFYIKLIAVTNGTFTFFMFNGAEILEIITHLSLITHDPKIVRTIAEHIAAPLSFAIYFIINCKTITYKINKINKFDKLNTYITIYLLVLFIPAMYMISIIILEAWNGLAATPYSQFFTWSNGKGFRFLLAFLIWFSLFSLFSTPYLLCTNNKNSKNDINNTINLINKNNKHKYQFLKLSLINSIFLLILSSIIFTITWTRNFNNIRQNISMIFFVLNLVNLIFITIIYLLGFDKKNIIIKIIFIMNAFVGLIFGILINLFFLNKLYQKTKKTSLSKTILNKTK